jgi:hypothetical protein
MYAHYVKDLITKAPQEWTKNEYENWLHPSHGRLPDHEGLVSFDGELYHVALWATENCLITCTEIVPFDGEWTAEECERLASKKGWILSSLRWSYDPAGFTCDTTKIEVHKNDEYSEEEWHQDIYRTVMIASVEKVVRTPIGITNSRIKWLD